MPFTSKEQTYFPFPDSNAVWQEVLLPYPPGPIISYMEHVEYTISGDTLINNILYKKLFITYYDVNCSEVFTVPSFAGGFRNDSVERKVYYYDLISSEEWILYDFTLDIGDTVPQTFNNISFPALSVESIDSVLIGDHFRKRYIYAQPTYPPIQVIEGIGAETGLLGYMEYFEVIYYLRCFHQDDNIFWMHPWVISCHLETDTCLAISVPEPISDDVLIRIFPNPASDLIYIQCSFEKSGYSGDFKLEIFNIFGEKVGESRIPKGSDGYSYNVSGLSDGIYIAIFRENWRIVSSTKFLIAK